jgi:hypothetical protein
MTTRRMTDSSIGAGGGGAVVRFQDDEPIAIRPGELWVESDGTASFINANDYLSKVDASAQFALRTPYVSASPNYNILGQLWVNADNNELFVFDGTNFTLAGGAGAKGGGNDKVFFENDQIITTDYTITTGKNAMSAGPVTINDSVTITIPASSVWTIV